MSGVRTVPTRLHHASPDGGQVVDRDRALEGSHTTAVQRLVALVQGAFDPGTLGRAGADPVEAGPPRLEPPPEHLGVEPAGPVHVVGVDGEVHDVVGHGLSI